VARYQALVAAAMARDERGFAVADLLATEGGRAYLLLDSAGADLG
jgi:hypothetical protein